MILVTGGTGLVGTHLLIALCDQDNPSIKATYRTKAKKEIAKQIFLKYNPHSNALEKWESIQWVCANVNDIPSLSIAFEGVTQVYHCAGYISFNRDEFSRLKKINIEGTSNMVNMALANKISKFCHVSTISVLNGLPNKEVLDEESHWNSEWDNSVYAISKFGAEMEVYRGIEEGLNAVIVNPGVIIGQGFFKQGSGVIFNNVQKGISFYTEGSTGYVSVQDTVSIMIQLMQSPIKNERFVIVSKNLSHQEALTIISKVLEKKPPKIKAAPFMVFIAAYIDHLLSKITKKEPIIALDMVAGLFMKNKYKSKKIEEALNYTFQPIENVLKETANAFKSTYKGRKAS